MELQEMTKENAIGIIDEYYAGGHFKNNLLKTVQSADAQNLKKLYHSYPELIVAHCVYTSIGIRVTKSDLYILVDFGK